MRKPGRNAIRRTLSCACVVLASGLSASGQTIDAAALSTLGASRSAPSVAPLSSAAFGASALVPALAAAPVLVAPAFLAASATAGPSAVADASAEGSAAPPVTVPDASAAQISLARDYFTRKGIPVAAISYTEGYYSEPDMPMAQARSWEEPRFTVRFEDAEAYRRWQKTLPRWIDDARVFVDREQHYALQKILQAEKEAALIARAREYFRRKGFSVSGVSYERGHDDGLGIGEGSSWVPPSFTVAFADEASYARWQKRWLRQVAGIGVTAIPPR